MAGSLDRGSTGRLVVSGTDVVHELVGGARCLEDLARCRRRAIRWAGPVKEWEGMGIPKAASSEKKEEPIV